MVIGNALNIMDKWYNEAVMLRNKIQNYINELKLINVNYVQVLQNTVLNN